MNKPKKEKRFLKTSENVALKTKRSYDKRLNDFIYQ